jgi:type IV pilus assembly protein PilA
MKIGWGSWIGIAGIVVIVALVVIPAIGYYPERSQAAEAVSLLSGAKTPLAEYFANHDKWPRSLEEVTRETKGKYTQGVVISKGAGGKGELELTATMKREGVHGSVSGKSVWMASKDGGRTWLCRAGTIEEKHLPGSCRPEKK